MRQYLYLFLLSAAPALGAPTLEELSKIVSIQQAKIQNLQSQITELKGYVSPCAGYGEVVFNSVANPVGITAKGDSNTLTFWNIPYADRLKQKGTLYQNLSSNFYNGSAYQNRSTVYTDLIEDLNGKIVVAMQAKASGFDSTTMKMAPPVELIAGNSEIYTAHFTSGWSSADYDGDTWESGAKNCAVQYSGVTQHYSGCWSYSLGSDADSVANTGNVHADSNWGPHLQSGLATAFGMTTDGTGYTRVQRITRCAR